MTAETVIDDDELPEGDGSGDCDDVALKKGDTDALGVTEFDVRSETEARGDVENDTDAVDVKFNDFVGKSVGPMLA